MSEKELITKLRSNEIKKIFNDNSILHAYLVGSYANGNFTDNSDIDVLYEEKEEANNSLFGIIRLKNKLEEVLKKNVDIADINFLNKHYKDTILKNKILLF